MTIRRKIVNLIEENYPTELILMTLYDEEKCTDVEIFDVLRDNEQKLSHSSEDTVVLHGEYVIPIDLWLIQSINSLRERIKFNNKVFKDVSIHDIIISREHTMQQNVELSNELYQLKQYVSGLEQEKKELQIKLDKARYCAKCFECEKCKNEGCINSILYNRKV